MNAEQWASLALEIDKGFKGGLDEVAEEVYRQHLGELDYDEARAAVGLLVQDGQVFTPTPGEIVLALRRLASPAAPPWAEAWPVIKRELASSRAPDEVVGAVLRDLGEGPGRFVARCGVGRLRLEQTDDPQYGGAVLARLQRDYEASCDAALEDGKVGVALDAAARSSIDAGRGGLKRLRPAGPSGGQSMIGDGR